MPLAGPIRVSPTFGEQAQLLVRRELCDGPEARVTAHVEIPVVIDSVGSATFNQGFDGRDHGGQRIHDALVVLRRDNPQFGHVLTKQLDLAVR